MAPELPTEYFNSVFGASKVPAEPTCMTAKPGTTLDYFCLSSGLALKARGAQALEGATAYPRLPVKLTLEVAEYHMWARVPVEPMQVNAIPLPGSARFPPVARWARAERLIVTSECA
eukprot:1909785-Pyramimonas_sp.AAC.1